MENQFCTKSIVNELLHSFLLTSESGVLIYLQTAFSVLLVLRSSCKGNLGLIIS